MNTGLYKLTPLQFLFILLKNIPFAWMEGTITICNIATVKCYCIKSSNHISFHFTIAIILSTSAYKSFITSESWN